MTLDELIEQLTELRGESLGAGTAHVVVVVDGDDGTGDVDTWLDDLGSAKTVVDSGGRRVELRGEP